MTDLRYMRVENFQRTNLISGETWPLAPALAGEIQVDVQHIDLRQMLEEAERSISSSVANLERDLLKMLPWGDNFSLRNLLENKGLEIFDETTGSILLHPEQLLSDSLFKERAFFAPGCGQYIENRGPRYYICLDRSGLSSKEKLDEIQDISLRIALVLEKFSTAPLDHHIYMEYLALLDYLKQFSLTLHRYLTFPERIGTFRSEDSIYHDIKKVLEDLTETYTIAFYATLTGHSPKLELSRLKEHLPRAIDYLKSQSVSLPDFDATEIDHPLKVLSSAVKTVLHTPFPDAILAIQSGGTQYGYVLKFLYTLIEESSPRLIHVPLSLHAAPFIYGRKIAPDFLPGWMKAQDVSNGICLIADDNSNTGTTLHLVQKALNMCGVQKIYFSLIEWDPLRIVAKHRADSYYSERTQFVLNCCHPDILATVSGQVPITYISKDDYQTPQLKALYILYNYYTKKDLRD